LSRISVLEIRLSSLGNTGVKDTVKRGALVRATVAPVGSFIIATLQRSMAVLKI
jgi:hypothetical protein